MALSAPNGLNRMPETMTYQLLFLPASASFFAQTKGLNGLVIRTIGLARATVKIGLANLTYNMKRAVRLSGRTAAA
jgi:hypothetical protein